MNKAFTPRRIADLEPAIRTLTKRMIDRFSEIGGISLPEGVNLLLVLGSANRPYMRLVPDQTFEYNPNTSFRSPCQGWVDWPVEGI